MLENNRLNELILRFPEDVQLIFKNMISSYQLGYVDYVYQTDNNATQNRRIKNLIKNFRRMDYFYIMPLQQDLALEIANQWRYEAPYDVYNVSANPEAYTELISPEARENCFFAVIRNAALMGYFRLELVGSCLEIGLGMKPSLTGQGNGRDFYQAIEDYIKEQYAPDSICLAVAKFNQRAQALYRAVGFVEKKQFLQTTNGSQYDCVRMEKDMTCD